MKTDIDRREAIRRVALMMGGAVSAPAILGMLAGCSAEPATDAEWKPTFLTQAQAALVAEVAEIMIPRTDTPGAKDVGIPAFIDKMLKDAYPKEEQARFFAGLTDLETQAKREHGRAFLELEPALRAALVKQVHDPAVEVDRASNLPVAERGRPCLLYTSPSPRDGLLSRMPSSA